MEIKCRFNDDGTITALDKRGSSMAQFDAKGHNPAWHQKLTEKQKEQATAAVGFFIADSAFESERKNLEKDIGAADGKCKRGCGNAVHRGRCGVKSPVIKETALTVRPKTGHGHKEPGTDDSRFAAVIIPLLGQVEEINGAVKIAGGALFEGVIAITAAGIKLDGMLTAVRQELRERGNRA